MPPPGCAAGASTGRGTCSPQTRRFRHDGPPPARPAVRRREVIGLAEKKPSARTGTAEQATNGIAIDGFCRTIEPIERPKPVVVPGARIGAVFEENRDRLHETCFGRVVKGCCTPAVSRLAC